MNKPRVSISAETKTNLEDIASKLNLSLGKTLEFLVDNFENINTNQTNNSQLPEYSESEKQEIDQAIKNSKLPFENIVKEGTLQRARYLNSIAENQAQLESMTDDELKEATFKGVSKHRISQAIETIMQHNDKQGEKKHKVCLTRGIVFKLTGSNRQNINKFFDNYNIMIDDHNQKHGLTDADNRKGKGFDFKKLLGV